MRASIGTASFSSPQRFWFLELTSFLLWSEARFIIRLILDYCDGLRRGQWGGLKPAVRVCPWLELVCGPAGDGVFVGVALL